MFAQNSYDELPSKFTGKERDSETGLDYFGARYYGSGVGRWMSADWSVGASAVPYATLTNPQTLNLYAYVTNNPLTLADPDGHAEDGPDPDKPNPGTNDQAPEVRQNSDQTKQKAQNQTVTTLMRLGTGTVTYTQTTTTIDQNQDGTFSNSQTVNTATFSTKDGEGGKFLSGSTQTSSWVVDNGKLVSGDPAGTTTSLSASGALTAFGGANYSGMQQSAAALGAPGFLTVTARDMRSDPVKYVGIAAGITAKVCPNQLCRAAAGAVAAGAGAYEAWKQTYGGPSQ